MSSTNQCLSSAEPKARVSLSVRLSIVCRCPSNSKLFTFPSCSPEPLGKQPNLTKSILGMGEWD